MPVRPNSRPQEHLPPRLNPRAQPVEEVRVGGNASDAVGQARAALLEAKRLQSTWLDEGNPLERLLRAGAWRGVGRLWLERAEAIQLSRQSADAEAAGPAGTARLRQLLKRTWPLGEEAMPPPADHTWLAVERSLDAAERAAGLPHGPDWTLLADYLHRNAGAPPPTPEPRGPQRLGAYPLRPDPWRDVTTELARFKETAEKTLAAPANAVLSQGLLKSMKKGRGWEDYCDMFPGLADLLARLGPEGLWADIGGGNFNAVSSYLTGDPSSGRRPGRAKTLGVDLLASPLVRQIQERFPGRFQFLEGNLTGVPLEGRADVITDNYGAFAYDRDPAGVLQRYADLLVKGGRLYLAYNEYDCVEGHVVPNTRVLSPDGSTRELSSWVGTLAGFEVLDYSVIEGGARRLILEKTADDVLVPELALLGYATGMPPRRVLAAPALLDSESHRR